MTQAQPRHSHDGGHGHGLDVSLHTRRVLSGLSIAGAVAVAVGMLVIGFGTDVKPSLSGVLAGKVYEAKVLGSETGPCAGTTSTDQIDCRLV